MPYLWYSGSGIPEKLEGEALKRWAEAYNQERTEAERDLWVLVLAACRGLAVIDPGCCLSCEMLRERGHGALVELVPALSGRFQDNAEVALRLLDSPYTEEERQAFMDDQERLIGEVAPK